MSSSHCARSTIALVLGVGGLLDRDFNGSDKRWQEGLTPEPRPGDVRGVVLQQTLRSVVFQQTLRRVVFQQTLRGIVFQ